MFSRLSQPSRTRKRRPGAAASRDAASSDARDIPYLFLNADGSPYASVYPALTPLNADRDSWLSLILRDVQFWVPVAVLIGGLLVLRWIS